MSDGNLKNRPPETAPKNWFIWFLFLVVAVFFIANDLLFLQKDANNIPYSEFLSDVTAGKVEKVTLIDSQIVGQLKAAGDKKPAEFTTVAPPNDPQLVDRLRSHGVEFSVEPQSHFGSFLISWVLPILVFYLAWRFLARRMPGGGAPGGLLGMTKSKARVYVEKDTKTSFADVAGVDEAKEELRELVSFLKNPERYARLGGRSPKGILLVGPPGTGKTMLARAVAGEAQVPFFSINGSEFVEMFVGLGAARVRDLFEQAKRTAPCLIFIDEIDALGRSRVAGMPETSGSDEKEQTLNQLLAEMDGFDAREGVIILAATNRPEVLDPALLRAGRFDRQILVNVPDKEGRIQILKVHSRGIVLDKNVRLEDIAALTPGFSGADLANLLNEGALIAARRNADAVTQSDLTAAIERIVAGLEHKQKVLNPEERRRVAYHEMGHATVALSRKSDVKIHKISIIARGMGSLGYTLQRPSEERYLMDRDELLTKIAILMGGRASEQLFFKTLSTGASDDLAKATDLARSMVTQYGMSEAIGPATIEERPASFLTGRLAQTKPISEMTAQTIDSETKANLERGLDLAMQSVELNRAFIEAGAKKLLEVETLDEHVVWELWKQLGKNAGEATFRVVS